MLDEKPKQKGSRLSAQAQSLRTLNDEQSFAERPSPEEEGLLNADISDSVAQEDLRSARTETSFALGGAADLQRQNTVTSPNVPGSLQARSIGVAPALRLQSAPEDKSPRLQSLQKCFGNPPCGTSPIVYC